MPGRSASARSTCAGNAANKPVQPTDSGNNNSNDRVAPKRALPDHQNSATNYTDHRYQEALLASQSDTSPFFGGGAIINGAGAICSLGFRAYRPSTSSYIELTANHCRDSFATSWSTFAGSSVGNNSAGSSVTDSMIVTPASGKAFSNGMWYGSYYATTSRPIPTGYNPGDGTTVYANGALRGQSTQAVADIDRFVGTQGPLFLIQSTNGGRNIGGGDSGGPVYNLINGSGVGRGLINEALASSFKGSCTQGDPDFDYTGCYASVWASQIDEIEDVLNVSVG